MGAQINCHSNPPSPRRKRIGARSPGPCPSLSVTLAIASPRARPSIQPRLHMLELAPDMRQRRMVRDGTRAGRVTGRTVAKKPQRQLVMCWCRGVNGIGKFAVWERSRGVLTDPADPDGLACPFPDGARTGHPEFPVRNIEHVIGGRFPLGLYCEDKDVSPDPDIHAVFVACRIKTPGR